MTRCAAILQDEANLYLGILFFSICAMLFNNWAEFAIITQRLPVFYKQVSHSWALVCITHWRGLHCSFAQRNPGLPCIGLSGQMTECLKQLMP